MKLDLDLIKKHLNIEQDFTEDDSYLDGLSDVAFNAAKYHLNLQDESELYNDDGELEPLFEQAVLLLIGTLYNNRESIAYGGSRPVPHAYEYLLQQLKNYTF